MNRKIRTLLSGFFGILMSAGIAYEFGHTIFGTIEFAKFDFSLPSSLKEFVSGMILAAFVSFAVGIFATAAIVLATSSRARRLSGVEVLIGSMMASIVNGGLLIFVIPTWIAAIAMVVGVGVPAYVVWQERATDIE